MQRVPFAVVLLTFSACASNEPTGPAAGQPLLPSRLRLVAEAVSVNAAGLRIECSVETFVTLTAQVDRSGGRIVQHGEGGGDARRYRDLSTDRAIDFWAHTYFTSLEFHLIGTDSVEVRSPESVDVTERFWRAFALWAGHTTAHPAAGELARGSWTCWPMDTPPSSGEYYDAEGVAEGTWTLLADPS